ncbi:hypothetical protein [Candidatus Desulfovibrio trichonymphae]|uniref:Uncharacterized protein n=1 Tax=Candidatus Desulfovibrio trichonymphae TaxID=1725232 RepID=A0A1J1DQH1_9BACT|nr:hypothetical protein [Candidatus Desulfovibrio trichonymphae]BAV92071.1 conserved hypothetical protein [Candidatus Desulfovibrio trichonymphae]GHU92384.1 hypothetical protein AGMMS49925_10570 [Deltaproteobacteria bacterium]GHU94741.1 hypothetical protein AGMMS49974_04750 [Deltaproteobacteria bacterium]GHU99169.1 hypothetical protein AGMMS50248_06860 [Deltaproteobacteria bacterium]
MSWNSGLKDFFAVPSTDDVLQNEKRSGFAWNQNACTVLAIIAVVLSAFVVYRIVS